jgi:fructoselysine 3-epimerase
LKLGLVTSVYVNYPLAEVIPRVAAAGYELIDIWGGRPHVYRDSYTRGGLLGLRNLVENNGIKVSSFLPAFYRYPHSLSSSNEGIRLDTLDYVRQCADNAAILGAEYVLVCPSRLLPGQSLEDGWQRLADSLNAICDYVYQYPIRVMLEPVNKTVFDIINTCADAMRMLGQINRANLGVVLDTGHLNLSDETIDEALDRLGEHLLMVHASDNDGTRQQNLVPGEGNFDFYKFLSALKHQGYAGVISAELSSDYAADPDPPVMETARRLKEWLAEV